MQICVWTRGLDGWMDGWMDDGPNKRTNIGPTSAHHRPVHLLAYLLAYLNTYPASATFVPHTYSKWRYNSHAMIHILLKVYGSVAFFIFVFSLRLLARLHDPYRHVQNISVTSKRNSPPTLPLPIRASPRTLNLTLTLTPALFTVLPRQPPVCSLPPSRIGLSHPVWLSPTHGIPRHYVTLAVWFLSLSVMFGWAHPCVCMDRRFAPLYGVFVFHAEP